MKAIFVDGIATLALALAPASTAAIDDSKTRMRMAGPRGKEKADRRALRGRADP